MLFSPSLHSLLHCQQLFQLLHPSFRHCCPLPESSSKSNGRSPSSLSPFLLWYLYIFPTFYFLLSISVPPSSPWKRGPWQSPHPPTPTTVVGAKDEAFKMSACVSCAGASATTRSPVSLVFLCALLFLLPVRGGGAAKPVDGDKEKGLKRPPFKRSLFALGCVTFCCNH